MNMSNRLTFSILSIFLLLAFVAVPVWSHAPDPDAGAVGNLVHDHPLLEELPAQNLNPGTDPGQDGDTDDPGEALVGPHNDHPTPVITLKSGQDNVRGTTIALDATTNTTFTLVVDYDRDVVAASTTADTTGVADADLTIADTSHATLQVDNVEFATDATLVITRVTGDASMFEVVVTPGLYPDADTAATATNDDTLRFQIQLPAGGLFSLQTTEDNPNAVGSVTVAGGASLASAFHEFTLVSELPAITPPPQPTIAIKDSEGVALSIDASMENDAITVGVETTVMLDVTGAAADSAIGVGEYVVFQTGTDDALTVLSPSYNPTTGELKFTPRTTDPVTVRVNAGAVVNAADPPVGNEQTEAVLPVNPAPDKMAPTVMITSEIIATGDDAGKVRVTFTFSEALKEDSFTLLDLDYNPSEIIVHNSNPVKMEKAAGDTSMTEVYTLLIQARGTQTETTITLKAGSVMDMANNPFGAAVSEPVMLVPAAPPGPDPTDPSGDNYSGVITIPAAPSAGTHNTNGVGSYVVVVRDKDAAMGAGGLKFRSDVMVVEWSGMPDLERLFYTGNDGVILGKGGGGALILTESVTQTGDFQPGTVGISEIMWAIDANHLGDPELSKFAGSQWIELHNLNTAEAKVILSWKTGRDITSDANITGNLANPKLDVVTNFFNDRPGNARWEVHGSNGASVAGHNFVSMARTGTFSLNRRHENKTDKPFNMRYTRTGGSENSRDGRNKDHWAASTSAYLSARTTRTDGNDVLFKYVGTPGRVNTFAAESQPHLKDSRTSVPSDSVIFNEIANRSDADKEYEWIELRNVGGSTVNLRNYLISMVINKNDDGDKILYEFPNANLDLPAGEVLLLVDTDPRGNPDHPLAVGYNVDIDPEDQVVGTRDKPGKPPIRYKVTDFVGNGLQDNGEFVLILRRPDNHEGHRSGADGGKGVAERGKDDLDKIVDIAGYHPDLKRNSYSNPVSSTNLWPLRNFRPPNFNLNQLKANTVHYRQKVTTADGAGGAGSGNNKNEGGQAAFRDEAYTGIGYKLQAADSAKHGGTPGYHGNIKGKVSDGKVIISEIMLSQGARGNLPQWIELYNPSKTNAVNLADNAGWRLVIENPGRAPIITINFKHKGNVKYIPPNSTVLIVSSSARDYGSDTLPRGTVFPDTRVLNAYTAIRGETFEIGRGDPLLDPSAFNVRLLDGTTTNNKPDGRYAGIISDEIGNLDGNPRTNDAAAWEFPKGMTADGDRTSFIRIFDEDPMDGVPGVARDGTGMVRPIGAKRNNPVQSMYSWVPAVDTGGYSQLVVRHTWFGDESDYGSPADRTGQTLPVELSHFRPTLENGKVTIRWTTESELDNAGFNILRSDTRDGEFKQVNAEMIQGHGTTGERHTYKWVDESAKPNVVYYYQIEDVSFAGERQTLQTTKLKGLISARGKATTTWGDIKEVQ